MDYPLYRSSLLWHPTKDLCHVDPEIVELSSQCFSGGDVDPVEPDMTIQRRSVPIGEPIVVTGRVVDSNDYPVRRQLLEIWQADAAGRYIHKRDQHSAPIDPNFTSVARCPNDADDHYWFTTIKPGPYPWSNHRMSCGRRKFTSRCSALPSPRGLPRTCISRAIDYSPLTRSPSRSLTTRHVAGR
ncbi:hypothetical protein BWK49_01500 [Mycobacterium intracellulare subsp. chimaera]|nr:hypothetical protein BWK49_01500 [Mycobacterium intracellulare subsp. chimaera]ETZ36016.1 dioxygenase family protein [Mycobacterium intracellulare MIN_052511_1280]